MGKVIDRSLDDFAQAVSLNDDEDIDLAHAALLVARIEHPRLEVEPYLELLDTLARQVVARAGARPDLLRQVQALLTVVLKEQGLRGAEDNYYDPRNSFLSEVLERRVGIPIALSIILIAVGARAGIALGGTSVPMHFLVRVLGVEPPVFIDCYNGGRIMSEEACRRMVELLSQGTIPFHPGMLEVIGNAEVLARFLTNLKLIYLGAGIYDRALRILNRLLVLNPGLPSLLRERGLVNYQLGHKDGARQDLRTYLDVAEHAIDATEIRTLLRSLD